MSVQYTQTFVIGLSSLFRVTQVNPRVECSYAKRLGLP